MSIERAERDLKAVLDEMAQLDIRIGQARERAIKLQNYIELATEFDRGTHANGPSTPPPAQDDAENQKTNGTRHRVPQGGMSGRAVRECISILRSTGKPAHTKTLYEMIQQRGIHLGGSNPMQALSGYLSRTPEVVSDRTLGWSLKEWNKPEGVAS